MKTLLYNPVLIKELKLRFRSVKSSVGLLFYLLALSVFVFGMIFIATNFTGTGFFRPEESYYMFIVLTYIQLGLILFITPGLTAGTISTEREKQTLTILLTTSQKSWQIIFGKLASSLAFLVLMLISGLPIYSLVFLFGGVSPIQLVQIFLFFLLTVLAIGSLGIMFSTITKKTIVSMIATYGSMMFLAGVTAFFMILAMQASYGFGMGAPSPSFMAHFWASINPGIMVFSLVSPDGMVFLKDMTQVDFPIWITYVSFYILLTAFALFIAIKKLRVNMGKMR
ncbi:ABC transporter permease subunit [Chryseomicrobium palamuruense]